VTRAHPAPDLLSIPAVATVHKMVVTTFLGVVFRDLVLLLPERLSPITTYLRGTPLTRVQSEGYAAVPMAFPGKANVTLSLSPPHRANQHTKLRDLFFREEQREQHQGVEPAMGELLLLTLLATLVVAGPLLALGRQVTIDEPTLKAFLR